MPYNGTLLPGSQVVENTGMTPLLCALFQSAILMAPKRYRSVDEVTCGDYYEGYFLNSRKSGVGSYSFGTAKAKYIGACRARKHPLWSSASLINILRAGEFVDNKFCGFGVYTSSSETYRGTFVNDQRHGRGVAVYNSINGCIRESLYVGDFKNGRRHGLGRLNFVNCSTWALFRVCFVFLRADVAGRYFGEFCNGHMHGIGALSCFDGCKVPTHTSQSQL
jgi:hypothetical protein